MIFWCRYFSSVRTKRAFDLYRQDRKSPYLCRHWNLEASSDSTLCRRNLSVMRFFVSQPNIDRWWTLHVRFYLEQEQKLKFLWLLSSVWRTIRNPVEWYALTVSQTFVQYTILCQHTLVFAYCCDNSYIVSSWNCEWMAINKSISRGSLRLYSILQGGHFFFV
jgi:hypothetical protein